MARSNPEKLKFRGTECDECDGFPPSGFGGSAPGSYGFPWVSCPCLMIGQSQALESEDRVEISISGRSDVSNDSSGDTAAVDFVERKLLHKKKR